MRRPVSLLCLIAFLGCAVALLPPPAANSQEEPQADSSGKVVEEAEPFGSGELQGTDGQEKGTGGRRPPTDETSPPMVVPAWHPPAPNTKDYDWIRLNSGEWLKGDIIQMREDEFEFESDELGDLSFDWEDIAEIRSPRKYTYVFANRTSLTGTAVISNDRVVIGVDDEEHVLERAELMSIIPAGHREWDRWDGRGSIGLSFRRGNTEQTDLTYQGFLRRQTEITRIRLDYNGNLGVIEGEETSNNHRGFLKDDVFLSPRFYVTPAAIEVFYDNLQNIQIRLTPSAGIGYHALKRKRVHLELELAGGYQITRYCSVEPGEDEQKGKGAVIPTLRLKSDPLRRVEIDALYTAQVSGREAKENTQHGEIILSVELTKVLELDISWIWDHVQNPSPNEEGTIPKRDDIKLSVGIGIDF